MTKRDKAEKFIVQKIRRIKMANYLRKRKASRKKDKDKADRTKGV